MRDSANTLPSIDFVTLMANYFRHRTASCAAQAVARLCHDSHESNRLDSDTACPLENCQCAHKIDTLGRAAALVDLGLRGNSSSGLQPTHERRSEDNCGLGNLVTS
jgi:hypothetical protein